MKLKNNISIIFAIILVITLSINLVSAFTWNNPNLANYYNFNEQDTSGTGLLLDSKGIMNLTNVGTSNVSGILGTAYKFDGTNDFMRSTVNVGIIGMNKSRTFTWWQKFDNLSSPIRQVILGYGGSNATGRRCAIDYYNPDTTWNTDFYAVGWGWTYVPSVTNWEFNAVVMNTNGSIYWYVNGTLKANGVPTNQFNTTDGLLEVGRDAFYVYYFNGTIDELGIWNESLTQQSITDLWNNGVGLTYDGVIPTATLGTNPVDNFNTSSTTIVFDAKCSDNMGLTDLEIWANDTGTWHNIATQTSPTNNTWYNISISGLTQSGFRWGVRCNDSSGWMTWSTNRTIRIDATPPVITLPFYSNATKYKNTQSMIFNVSVIDAGIGSSLCSINVNGGTNQTITVSSNWCNGTYILTGIADGNQTINAYANDTVNNFALNNSYVVLVDITPPVITLPFYSNATQKNNTQSITLNISVIDATTTPQTPCFIDVTGTNQTLAYSNGWCNGTVDLTGLTNGNKIIKVYDNDTLNNMGLNNSYVVSILNQQINVTLISPSNGISTQTPNQTFVCNVSSAFPVSSMNFTLWNSSNSLITYQIHNWINNQIIPNATSYSGSWTNPTNMYDGSFSSYGYVGGIGIAYYYANYTIPLNDSVTWGIVNDNDYGGVIWQNISIPNDCLTTTNLTLRTKTTFIAPQIGPPIVSSDYYCWNGDWKLMKTNLVGRFYEGMIFTNATQSFNFTLPHEDNYTWNCIATDNSGMSNFSASNFSLGYFPTLNVTSQSFESNTLEQSNYVFNATVNLSTSQMIVYPTFNYNGIDYTNNITSVTSLDGLTVNFSKIFNIPYINNTNLIENRTFYWSFIFNDGESNYTSNSTANNQTANQMMISKLSSCNSDYPFGFYTINYKDELMESTLLSVVNQWDYQLINPENTSFARNYTSSSDASSHKFCVHYTTTDHYFRVRSNTSAIIVIPAESYQIRADFVCTNTNITSWSRTMYIINGTTQYQKFFFHVKDSNQLDFAGAILNFEKWQSNQWLYVGSQMTDEYGSAVLKLVEDKSYRISVYDENCTLVKTFMLTLTCETLPCDVEILTSEVTGPLQPVPEIPGFSYIMQRDPITGMFYLSYQSTGGTTDNVRMEVYQKRYDANVVDICDQTSLNASDTMSCNLSGYTTGNFEGKMTVTNTDGTTTTRIETWAVSTAKQVFGTEMLFWAMLVILALFFVGIWNPTVALCLSGLGVFFFAFFGLILLSITSIVMIVVLIGIFIYKSRT